MGTINHATSKFITLASIDYNHSDFENDADFLEEYKDEIEENGMFGTISRVIDEYLEDDAANIRYILNKYNFRYFSIEIEPGYYEGFSLQIEFVIDKIHDSEDKRLAQKEITQLKQCLIECAGSGVTACWPGWCMKYFDYPETLRMIDDAAKEMRQAVKETQTDYTYWRNYKAV